MSVRVRYFASLRERVGRTEDYCEANPGLTVAGLWAALFPDQALPDNVLAAVNLQHCGPEQAVADGDEVAFFPPVTGG